MTRRLRLGRDLAVVNRSLDGLDLEGTVRLRPGHPIDLIESLDSQEVTMRRASVTCWCVAEVGREGTRYRGRCVWIERHG
jgi:hypothetical protein